MTAREQYAEVLAAHSLMVVGDTGCTCGWMWTLADFGSWSEAHRNHVADALAAALPDPEQAVRDALDEVLTWAQGYGDKFIPRIAVVQHVREARP